MNRLMFFSAWMRNALLMMALVPVLAGCGNNKLSREEVAEYGEIGYSDIISYIVVGYQSHWDDMSPEEMNLSPVYSYCSPYAGFTKRDIDGDGFDELLIGDQFENGDYVIYDIYCFNKKDASLIHLASGGERDRFVINGEGVIIETGSNAADDSFVRGCVIRDDRLVEVDGWEESLMKLDFEKFSDIAAPRHLAGGYTDQREPVEEEMEMFRSAAASADMTFTPLSVSTQVVAGINYKFWCRFQGDEGSGHCWVIIFKPLPGQGDAKITSIDISDWN